MHPSNLFILKTYKRIGSDPYERISVCFFRTQITSRVFFRSRLKRNIYNKHLDIFALNKNFWELLTISQHCWHLCWQFFSAADSFFWHIADNWRRPGITKFHYCSWGIRNKVLQHRILTQFYHFSRFSLKKYSLDTQIWLFWPLEQLCSWSIMDRAAPSDLDLES